MITAQNEVTAWSPNFAAYGVTTIVWGTEGIFGSYIVTSASESQRIEEIDIEQGAGFEAVVILLNKGFDVELTVIDDTAITPPTIANAPFTLVTPYGTVNMLLVGNKSDQARKREGMKNLTFRSYNAINGLH